MTDISIDPAMKRRTWRNLGRVAASLCLATALLPAQAADEGAPLRGGSKPVIPTMPAAAPADWRETYAYTLGVQACVFGSPWINMAR
jgi:hypothetical protein